MSVAYFCDGNMFYIYVSKPHMTPVVKSCAKPFRRTSVILLGPLERVRLSMLNKNTFTSRVIILQDDRC